MPDQRNYYVVLGVPPDATADDIKHAYRRLVKRVHPDTSSRADATRLFRELQQAYETLGDADRRKAYDAELAVLLGRRQVLSSLAVRIQASHSRLPYLAEAQMLYAIVEVRTASLSKPERPAVNLCVVLDRSLSMAGPRLLRAQEATALLIDLLTPADILSLVTFSDRAQLVVSGNRGEDRTVAKSSVLAINPSGGTELLQGVSAGLAELRRWRTRATVDHLILITDGHTYGDEAGCIDASTAAAAENIGLTLLGMGSDWNDHLMDDMAARSGGYATYIDSPSKLAAVTRERFNGLANASARDVRLLLTLEAGTRIAGAYRLVPDIARLQLDDGRCLLGALEADRPARVLLELLISTRIPGTQHLARVKVTGELVAARGSREEASAQLDLDVSSEPPAGKEPPDDFADLLERIAIFKVQEKAMADAERGDSARATARLRHLSTHLLDLGEADLANAAMREANELSRTGRLSAEGRKYIRYGTRSLAGSGEAKGKP